MKNKYSLGSLTITVIFIGWMMYLNLVAKDFTPEQPERDYHIKGWPFTYAAWNGEERIASDPEERRAYYFSDMNVMADIGVAITLSLIFFISSEFIIRKVESKARPTSKK